MRATTFFLALFVFPFFGTAQNTAPAAPVDTVVYNFAEAMPYPLLTSCVTNLPAKWNRDSIKQCAELQLMSILSGNIRYPQEAREKDLQGTVVVSFVVEPTGKMSNLGVLKDIGGGCGGEALRVFKALDEAGLRFQPGLKEGKPVRVRQSIPLRFKLQDALPYYINEAGDSVYLTLDSSPQFRGGLDSLASFAINRLQYPPAYVDSCKTGVLEMALLIDGKGGLRVENQLDFSNLGMDFQWEGLRLARQTAGLWTPAQYQGQPVMTSLPLRVVFKSDRPKCAAANKRFDDAMILANDGALLLEENKTAEALAKWDQAIKLQPDNTEILYYRATALLNENRREEACKDYNRIKQLLGYTWFEGVRKLVCGY